MVIDSTLDYSTAGRVMVTVRCTTCDSAANSLPGVLRAGWSMPDAANYTTTEMKPGTAFLFWDSGAAISQVFGSQFRLTLQNKDKQGLIVHQVTIFRR